MSDSEETWEEKRKRFHESVGSIQIPLAGFWKNGRFDRKPRKDESQASRESGNDAFLFGRAQTQPIHKTVRRMSNTEETWEEKRKRFQESVGSIEIPLAGFWKNGRFDRKPRKK